MGDGGIGGGQQSGSSYALYCPVFAKLSPLLSDPITSFGFDFNPSHNKTETKDGLSSVLL